MLKPATVFCLAFLVWTRPVQAAAPDLFALTDPGDQLSVLESLAQDPRVDGLAIRTSWDGLQPAPESYDLSRLDTAFAVAQKYHKKITLHILSSAYGRAPEWVFANGARHYRPPAPPVTRSRQPRAEPLPWDNVYLQSFAQFLSGLQDHLKNKGYLPLLGYISAAVPVPEMSLPDCFQNSMGKIAYDRSRYLAAWRYSLAAYVKYFPAIPILVSAPVWTICRPDQDGASFYGSVITQALQDNAHARLMVYATDLTARGSDRMTQAAAAPALPVGFQMMGQSSNDPRNRMLGSLKTALCSGLNLKGSYFEIYKDDILNQAAPTLQQAISGLHEGRCQE